MNRTVSQDIKNIFCSNNSHKFMLKISHILAFDFLAEINLNFVKKQHICFHGNNGSNMAVGDVSTADL